MRETELWARLRTILGAAYAGAWAESVVHADLGDRTVLQALGAGIEVKRIWQVASASLEVPEHQR